MKQSISIGKLRLAVLIASCFFCLHTDAQNITYMEYFFDTDPGVGNATQVLLPLPADSITCNTTINTTGLQTGNHVLFVRTRLSTGVWSLFEPREFFVKQPMILAEYFFDADPGVGNGTPLPLTAAADSTTIVTSVSTTGLPTGNHVLFVRTMDASGHWSLYHQKEFFIKQPMVSAEYFFDTDPGIGNGTTLPVIPGADSTAISTSVSTAGLASGNHVLFIRTKDASGHWSMYQPRAFFIQLPILAAEYFFDTDPGMGNGISLSVTPVVDSTTITHAVSTAGLSSGRHTLFVRTKDASGKWSFYEPKEFFIKQSILAAEYFIDTDPGVGNGIPLTIGMPGDSISMNATISPGALAMGMHFVFVRTKDDKGIWSLYEPQEFIVGSPLPVEWLGFTAVRKDKDALLSWITGSEINCSRFDVERMIPENGNVFHKIGEVAGNGNSTVQHAYYFKDENVNCKDAAYYRIRQVDEDGNFTVTQTVAVHFERGKMVVKMYPNPSSEYFTMEGTANDEADLGLEIITGNGQLVKRLKDLTLPFSFGSELNPGTYFVRILNQSETINIKIIKTN